ncbi:FecR family protein [Breznakiella homolactica]|uniref:FecR domain-containing protein n=1 Tax=Breznakiella homolactica TaxID=2798577 RepID=A0A7T8B923_9SPIR|nr:FecR family protein [Breznakiella homolactica]QQO07997.1 FecR family protein [Breznakiella homolactica]
MKKIIAFLTVALTAAALFAQEPAASVREVSGKVEIKAPGSANWVAAAPGMRLSRDTIVSTGFKSTAQITLGDSVLTVKPLTRLTLAELSSSGDTEQVRVNLAAGRVRADVNPPAGRRTDFTVRSPSATASVRGTSFDFDSDRLTVFGGTVSFTAGGGNEVLVDQGGSTFINADGQAVSPNAVAAANAAPQLPLGASQRDINAATSAPSKVGQSGSITVEVQW